MTEWTEEKCECLMILSTLARDGAVLSHERLLQMLMFIETKNFY